MQPLWTSTLSCFVRNMSSNLTTSKTMTWSMIWGSLDMRVAKEMLRNHLPNELSRQFQLHDLGERFLEMQNIYGYEKESLMRFGSTVLEAIVIPICFIEDENFRAMLEHRYVILRYSLAFVERRSVC